MFKGKRIAVVSDDVSIYYGRVRWLEGLGIELVEAEGFTEAVTRIADILGCDLVIVNPSLEAPNEVDGEEQEYFYWGLVLLNNIRSQSETIPIVADTAAGTHVSAMLLSELRKLNATPINIGEFPNTLRKHFEEVFGKS